MEIIACQCNGYPPHDHIGAGYDIVNGVLVGRVSEDPVHIWVDWKEYARELIRMANANDT